MKLSKLLFHSLGNKDKKEFPEQNKTKQFLCAKINVCKVEITAFQLVLFTHELLLALLKYSLLYGTFIAVLGQ